MINLQLPAVINDGDYFLEAGELAFSDMQVSAPFFQLQCGEAWIRPAWTD
jgi:hypothetical protein